MSSSPSPGTDEQQTAFRKLYLIIACFVLAPLPAAIIIKLNDGELSYSFWFGTLFSFLAALLGLWILYQIKKGQRSEKN